MKKFFKKFLIWLCVFNVGVASVLGLSLTKAKAAPDPMPVVQFASSASSGSEKPSPNYPIVKVTLSSISLTDVLVDYKVTGGTAVAGKNFNLTDDTLTIAAGKLSDNVPLEIIDDGVVNADKTVEITLSNPVNATLGANSVFTYTILEADTLSITKIVTEPSVPDGRNNWFVNSPTLTFFSDREVTTYYQWNNTSTSGWETYGEPFLALEGINTLYFYSVDSFGNVEEVNHATFKVDTTAPVMPSAKATVGSDGYITLSWSSVNDANSYEVKRTDSDKTAKFSENEFSYFDQNTMVGQSYRYEIWAVDIAGNRSHSKKVSVTVSKIEVITTTQSEPIIATQAVTSKSISSGASTQKTTENLVTPAPQETPKAVEGTNETTTPASTNEPTQRNWSQLLLAISILVIAAGAAIGGYYGYEWWMEKRDDNNKIPPKSKSRW